MKMCLISAPTANDFIDETLVEDRAIKAIAEHAPLGILSLAAVMEENGVTPDIIDLNRLYYSWVHSEERKQYGVKFHKFILTYFADKPYDVFGFSTICSSYPLTLRISHEIKTLFPQSTIILGGPQASVVDVATMETYPSVDFIVRGEAEITLPRLMRFIGGAGQADLAGVTYRENGAVVRCGDTPILESLDDLPFPSYHLYPYTNACGAIPLELGRGCPFACTFCSTNDFFRRRFRLKKPDHIIGEMKRVRETYGVYNFNLVHDMFTVDRKKVVAFCEAVQGCGEKFFWSCSARTDCVDEELIALMAQSGCRGIFFGIETGSEKLQRTLKKNLDLRESTRMIEETDKHNIKTAVSLITGFPEETPDDLRDTVAFFVDSLRFDNADPQFCLLAPLAETPIQSHYRDQLLFDDVISDMSFQGWEQDPEDRLMIERHRDIFPNFYSTPTPFLDRQFLKELREFLLCGMGRFRWVLVGLHQDSGDLVSVYSAWRRWRAENKPAFPNGNVTMYYAQPEFYSEFVEFLRTEYLRVAQNPVAISGLLDYAEAFDPECPGNQEQSACSSPPPPQDFGGVIGPELTPILRSGVRLTQVRTDYQKIIAALRQKLPLGSLELGARSTVATSDVEGEGALLLQLSECSTELLGLCDGRRTVAEVGARYSELRPETEGVPSELAAIVGLEMLRRQGLVVLVAGRASAAS